MDEQAAEIARLSHIRERLAAFNPDPAARPIAPSRDMQWLVRRIDDLGAERVQLREWLREVTHAEWREPCRLDHNGDCQSHGYYDEPCPIPAIAAYFESQKGASDA